MTSIEQIRERHETDKLAHQYFEQKYPDEPNIPPQYHVDRATLLAVIEKVEKLPRYEEAESKFGLTGNPGMDQDDLGEWVRWDDIEELLK
jgi:hypothetical protein